MFIHNVLRGENRPQFKFSHNTPIRTTHMEGHANYDPPILNVLFWISMINLIVELRASTAVP